MRILLTITLAACASLAAAHGVPIDLAVADGVLTVSHPADNYPTYVFGQVEEEGDPQGPVSLPRLGPSLLWDKPGLDIEGMADSASLEFEPIAHEFNGATQSLWYWDPTTRRVVTTPAGSVLNLLLAGGVHAPIPAAGAVGPVTIAATVEGETGYHNHTLMNYSMPYSSGSFNLGLYGVFGRLTSNEYGRSEMFLMVFNAGAAYEDLAPASEAIWLAANPGDYTLDGVVVDADDYSRWTENYGSIPAMAQTAADGNGDGVVDAADYTLWRDNLSAPAVSVPEPGAMLLVGVLLVGSAVRTVVGRVQRPLTPNTNLTSSR
jgi:hypothetical protein